MALGSPQLPVGRSGEAKQPTELSGGRLAAARRFWRALGPGIITGAADDDPSGIATYSIAGAQFGTGLLWMALLSWPLMAAVQTMCARIGMVTGRGLMSAQSSCAVGDGQRNLRCTILTYGKKK